MCPGTTRNRKKLVKVIESHSWKNSPSMSSVVNGINPQTVLFFQHNRQCTKSPYVKRCTHIQLFRERLSGKSAKVHTTIPWGNLGYDQWILITQVFKYIKLAMPRPYSNDLRWRAIWMVELLGYSVDEVAATLFMSPRTVELYISKCLNMGDVNSEKLGRPFNSFTMHPHVEFVIMEAILEQPDTTLAEIFVFLDESGFVSFYWTFITIRFAVFLLRLFWLKLTNYFCRTKDFLVYLPG